jgi:hypothetical protein
MDLTLSIVAPYLAPYLRSGQNGTPHSIKKINQVTVLSE